MQLPILIQLSPMLMILLQNLLLLLKPKLPQLKIRLLTRQLLKLIMLLLKLTKPLLLPTIMPLLKLNLIHCVLNTSKLEFITIPNLNLMVLNLSFGMKESLLWMLPHPFHKPILFSPQTQLKIKVQSLLVFQSTLRAELTSLPEVSIASQLENPKKSPFQSSLTPLPDPKPVH